MKIINIIYVYNFINNKIIIKNNENLLINLSLNLI